MPETVVTRRCSQCKSIKPLDQFTKNRSKPLGHNYECFPCAADSSREYYEKYHENHKNEFAVYRQRYKENNPEEIKARQVLNNAVRDGKILRPESCIRCNSTRRIQGHHYLGYAPEHHFDVMWFCESCHKTIHRLEEQAHVLAEAVSLWLAVPVCAQNLRHPTAAPDPVRLALQSLLEVVSAFQVEHKP